MERSLSAAEARGLALRAQCFGAEDIQTIDLLDRLGAIQLDSVNVLARNHLLVPFARVGPYSTDELHSAIYNGRRGFEYWGHMASWLPMADYRYFIPRMRRMQRESRGWWRRIRTDHADLYPLVLERVRSEGPIGAAAFEDPRDARGTWWDWKPAKLVLEDLLDQGLVMCSERTRGFARLYDIPERVLPSGLDISDPGEEEATRYLLLRGMNALGIATAVEIFDYYRLKPAVQPKARLKELVQQGQVVEMRVEGWKAPAYSTSDLLDGDLSVPSHAPTFLAPFDNLMWERSRVERLFGFRYRVEIYVPEAKRQYGYFVLPLLARGGLRGRADLKLDRQAGV
ncbi:MAG: YcaQ family DNA glycosylase, partial [Chloroflexi bacterium]|nr:YcaQ family DNA glycosylase [Chloroflexota bacterium]